MDTTLALHAPEARQGAEQVGEAQGPAQVPPPSRRAVLEAARAYAARGWFPLPVATGEKAAKVKGWAEKAREAAGDPAKCLASVVGFAEARWGGVAIVPPPGVIVVDVDLPNPMKGKTADGRKSLAAYEAEYGALPATLTQRSPSGGEHRIFRLPDGVSPVEGTGSRAGIDTRCHGLGYIVAAPSCGTLPEAERMDGGKGPHHYPDPYAWVQADGTLTATMPDGEPATLPASFLAWYKAGDPKPEAAPATPRPSRAMAQPPLGDSRKRRYFAGTLAKVGRIVEGTAQGGRNAALNAAALRCYRLALACDVPADEVTAALTAAAEGAGLGSAEVAATLRSAKDKADVEEPANLPPPKSGKPPVKPAPPHGQPDRASVEVEEPPHLGEADRAEGLGGSDEVEADPETLPIVEADSKGNWPPVKEVVAILAKAACHVWQDDTGQATWVDLWPHAKGASRTGPRFTVPLRSERFKHHAVRLYFAWQTAKFGRPIHAAPGASALDAAILGLEATAPKDGPAPALRSATGPDGALYVDLGDDTGEAVRIAADGWTIEAAPAVRFRRGGTMAAHPRPERGGSIADLRKYIRAEDDTWPLVVAWMLAAMGDLPAYPVLVIGGPQGSAKTTASTFIRRLVDPTVPKSEMRSPPKDEDDLKATASASRVLALDNVSGISADMADGLCRVATGGVITSRKKYTDSDEHAVKVLGPVLLNGIPDVATRPDLAERSFIVTLPPIADGSRREADEVDREFETDRPRILGALFDALACAMRHRKTTRVRLGDLPRMADAAVWGEAASEVTGLPQGAVAAAMFGSRDEGEARILDADPVAIGAEKLLGAKQGRFAGTLDDLFNELRRALYGDRPPAKDFPGTGLGLSRHLKRIAPLLARRGVVYLAPGDGGNSRRTGRVHVLRLGDVTPVTGVTGSKTELAWVGIQGEAPSGPPPVEAEATWEVEQEAATTWTETPPEQPAEQVWEIEADAAVSGGEAEALTAQAGHALPMARLPGADGRASVQAVACDRTEAGDNPEAPPPRPAVAPAALTVAPASPPPVTPPSRGAQAVERAKPGERFVIREGEPPPKQWGIAEQARLQALETRCGDLSQKRGFYWPPKPGEGDLGEWRKAGELLSHRLEHKWEA